MFSVERQRIFPWFRLLVGPNFALASRILGEKKGWNLVPEIQQEQIVLERSARLNLDPGRGD